VRYEHTVTAATARAAAASPARFLAWLRQHGRTDEFAEVLETLDTPTLVEICTLLSNEPDALDPRSLRIFDAARREVDWRTKAERKRTTAGLADELPPVTSRYDAFWQRLIDNREYHAWGAGGEFASNHAFIRWLREELRHADNDRGYRRIGLSWLETKTGKPRPTLKTWFAKAALSLDEVNQSPRATE
jgi:hypothetical protein